MYPHIKKIKKYETLIPNQIVKYTITITSMSDNFPYLDNCQISYYDYTKYVFTDLSFPEIIT